MDCTTIAIKNHYNSQITQLSLRRICECGGSGASAETNKQSQGDNSLAALQTHFQQKAPQEIRKDAMI